jgi:hypothetical protein
MGFNMSAKFLNSNKIEPQFYYHVGVLENDVFWSLFETSTEELAQKEYDNLVAQQPKGQWALIQKKLTFKTLKFNQNENTDSSNS